MTNTQYSKIYYKSSYWSTTKTNLVVKQFIFKPYYYWQSVVTVLL